MGTNGNQWGANAKAVGKFERYVLLFVINGNSMVNHWENSNNIFHQALLMGDQYLFQFSSNASSIPYTTGNILMVIITIHLFGEFNGITLRTL